MLNFEEVNRVEVFKEREIVALKERQKSGSFKSDLACKEKMEKRVGETNETHT